MMVDSRRAVAANAIAVDPASNDVVLTLAEENGSAFKIRLAGPIVGAVVTALVALGKKLETTDQTGLLGQVIHCPASAPLRQNRRVEEGRISGSS